MKHVHVRGIVAGALSLTKRIEVEASQEINLDQVVPGSATDEDYDLALDVSALKSLVLLADGALTIKTNDSGTPVNTITLVANQPFMWREGDGTLRDTAGTAIATDITEIFVTNPGSGDVQLYIFALLDPTAA